MLNPEETNIPRDEQEKFARHLYVYPFDSVIIQEGQDDHAVYLLREGSLAIERLVGNKVTRISTMEAVNFFGEMAMIVKAKRTATVRVTSNQAVVYKFNFVDLKSIYANPAWSELLIARLTNDLKDTNNRAVGLENDLMKMTEKNKSIGDQVALLLAALLSLQTVLASDLVINSKAWKLLMGMRDLTEIYTQAHLPEISTRLNQVNKASMHKLVEEEDFPEVLKPLL